MTDPRRSAILMLVDRSGSMATIKKSAEDSVNEFVSGRAADFNVTTTVRIVQFDAPTIDYGGEAAGSDWYLEHCPSTTAADVPAFELIPRGMTALYDAMGRAIDEFGAELSAIAENERPGTVFFTVMTDGQENSSREETADTIRTRVTHQADAYGWQFIYLGANQNAILEGERMGIPRASSVTYSASDVGTRSVMDSMGVAVAATSRGEGPVAFSDEDRVKAMRSGPAAPQTRSRGRRTRS